MSEARVLILPMVRRLSERYDAAAREQHDRERAQQAANNLFAPARTRPIVVVNNDRDAFNVVMLRLRQALNDDGNPA